MSKIKVGLQIFSVRDLYFENPAKTLKLIKECGYDFVEMFGGIIMGAEELKKLMGASGLDFCGWHLNWAYTSQPDILEAVASYNKTAGNKYMVIPWIPPELTKDLESCLKLSEDFAKIAKLLKKHGMYAGLHSHADEFRALANGEYPWDIIAKNTPEDFFMQLDLGNIYDAGVEPVGILKKYPGRARTIHSKPWTKEKSYGATIGEDIIDWKDVAGFCENKGKTEYFIIEISKHYEKDLQTAMIKNAANLKKYL